MAKHSRKIDRIGYNTDWPRVRAVRIKECLRGRGLFFFFLLSQYFNISNISTFFVLLVAFPG